MIDLDEDDLRQLCSEPSFSKGEKYFEEGRVRINEATPSRIKAVVSGTEDYHVEIELGEELSGECDCPYDWGGLCIADKGTGRKHYQEVVSYLKQMKSMEGYEGAVSEIVGQLRVEHRRKPAFIDEMKEL